MGLTLGPPNPRPFVGQPTNKETALVDQTVSVSGYIMIAAEEQSLTRVREWRVDKQTTATVLNFPLLPLTFQTLT